MEKEDFEIQICGIFNFYELQWWLNWWDGQEFIELQAIISPEMVRLCENIEEAEILEKLKKEN